MRPLAAIVAALALVGCSLDHNPFDARACTAYRGTYEFTYTERAGGTCGPRATQRQAYGALPSVASGCTGQAYVGADGCSVGWDAVCPAAAAPRSTRWHSR
jgi:hypothetical protein